MGGGTFKFDNFWSDHPSFKASFPLWWNVKVEGKLDVSNFLRRRRSLLKSEILRRGRIPLGQVGGGVEARGSKRFGNWELNTT